YLGVLPWRTKPGQGPELPPNCHPIALSRRFATRQRPVDGVGRLAVVCLEPVGVHLQRHAGVLMAETLADGHDVDALVNQLAGMGMPEPVKADVQAEPVHGARPSSRGDIGRTRAVLQVTREDQSIVRRFADTNGYAQFELLPAMFPQDLDDL